MRVYFDHNACTPVDPRVLERFQAIELACPGNPGALHQSGRTARAALEHARREIADVLAVDEPDRIVFVSGGTEANNVAVWGSGDTALPVLLAPVEHLSVIRAAERRGVVRWSVDPEGRAEVAMPQQPVGLVCLVHAQNEVGTIQPIERAAEVARRIGAPLHVDISQSLGRIAVDPALELADSLAISAHKLGGLRGLSILLTRQPDRLRPLLVGGTQEGGRRAGTPSPALAAATATAIRLAVEERVPRSAAMERSRATFEHSIHGVACRRLADRAHRLPNTVMYCFERVDGRNLLPALDLAGLEVSQGAACTTGSATPPGVLTAMGLSPEEARRCVRFSTGACSTEDDGRLAGHIVSRVLQRMQKDLDGASTATESM